MADDSALAVSIKQKMDPLQYEPEFGSLQNFSFPELLFTSASILLISLVPKFAGQVITLVSSLVLCLQNLS